MVVCDTDKDYGVDFRRSRRSKMKAKQNVNPPSSYALFGKRINLLLLKNIVYCLASTHLAEGLQMKDGTTFQSRPESCRGLYDFRVM